MPVQILRESALAGQSARDDVLHAIRTPGLRTFVGTVAAWIVRSGQRRALRELAKDRRLLRDVGLTREQVLREAGKPFWRR
jgi:uncharacterized protein YjiS (DUF1127 family)